MLSNLIKSVPSSAIIDTFNRAYDLRLNGADLIDLSVGEPDFDTPEHIRLAGIAAINTGDTRYSPSDGTAVLKQAELVLREGPTIEDILHRKCRLKDCC